MGHVADGTTYIRQGSHDIGHEPTFLWSPYGIGQTIIFSCCDLFFLLFCPRLILAEPLQIGCLPYFHTCRGLSANLRCRSQTCCTRLAEIIRTQKRRQKSLSGHHRTTLSGYIFATKARMDNRKKNLLSSNMSSTCPHNMVNFGLLAAEISLPVWGTPPDFNGLRVLAALLHGSKVVSVSQTLQR